VRLHSFEIKNVGPLKHVAVEGLSNVVVFAGPNGVGKTNINNQILQLAQNPHQNLSTWMIVEASEESEAQRWGKSKLDTRQRPDAQILSAHLQRNQRRNQYQGSFLNFDSDRAIRNVQSYGFSWDIGNPLNEDVGWNVGFQSMQNRYNDVRHSLFRIVEGQRRELADRLFQAKAAGQATMDIDFPDVLKPFKDAFWQLLGPKQLLEVSVKDQQIYFEHSDVRLPLDALSSGEKEVVNIVFDFILRAPRNCIVLFDEPELHLHPELSYKLLQTLAGLGGNNQFVFSTHSPEIISASLENTVIFVTPPQTPAVNQAIVVHREDATHHALQTLGQSIGVISLGKKLVLVEGEETSLDKQTYGAVLQGAFPEFVLVPIGGKSALRSFDEIRDSVLNKTIWGVEFYMLCDRDAVNFLGKQSLEAVSGKNVVALPRYHLENYFLDAQVWARAFSNMEPVGSWLRDPAAIRVRLRELAHSIVPYAVALRVSTTVRERVGNVSLMPRGASAVADAEELAQLFIAKLKAEADRLAEGLDAEWIKRMVNEEHGRLTKALADDSPAWMNDLPGRPLLGKFSGAVGIQVGRLKQMYLAAAEKSIVFADVFNIFEGFRASGK